MTECRLRGLREFLGDRSEECSLSAYCRNAYVVAAEDHKQFEELLEEFVGMCNLDRKQTDGYEVVSDFYGNGSYVFYVMCEDGTCVIELPVNFMQANLHSN